MNAEIIAIGDEITSGQLLDTNTQWLSLRLEELGVRVLYHSTVGDEIEPVAEVFRQAIRRADVVAATGGLGPTADDLTREAIAKAVDSKLELNLEALESIRALYDRRGRHMPERNEQQAMFPGGSRPIPNPNGTAPGVALDADSGDGSQCHLFSLPGVPAEMKEMWYQTVSGELCRRGAGQRMVRHRIVKCFGAGESQVEAMLPGLIRRGRIPRVGINASNATIILRITAEGATEEECYAAMEPTVGTIRESLGRLVYGEGDDELQHAVARLLRQQGKTLATAEWGTGGMIADWLAEVPEAEGHYLGGNVVRGTESLNKSLGVSADLLARHPAGSAEVVAATAEACRARFGADFGLAAGRFPDPVPEGTERERVCFALATSDGVKMKSNNFSSHPALLKVLCGKQALNLLRLALLDAADAG